MRFIQPIGHTQGFIHENITQILHVLHYCRPVESQLVSTIDTFTIKNRSTVIIIRHLDHHLGRHTAHARAGCSQFATFDQYIVIRFPAYL